MKKYFFYLAVALMASMWLTSCSDDDDSNESIDYNSKVLGTWFVTSVSQSNGKTTTFDINKPKDGSQFSVFAKSGNNLKLTSYYFNDNEWSTEDNIIRFDSHGNMIMILENGEEEITPTTFHRLTDNEMSISLERNRIVYTTNFVRVSESQLPKL